MSDKRSGRAPALFDDAAFAEDLRRASDIGRKVARAARKDFEAGGVPVGRLLACDEEGAEGTALRHCVKLRLPPPNGTFGMVFWSALRRLRGRHGRDHAALSRSLHVAHLLSVSRFSTYGG